MWRLLSGTTMPNGSHDVATLTAELQRELASLTARLLTADAWPRGVLQRGHRKFCTAHWPAGPSKKPHATCVKRSLDIFR